MILYVFLWFAGLVFTLTHGKLVGLIGAESFTPDLLAIGTAYIFLLYNQTGAIFFALSQGFFIDLFSAGMNGLFTFLHLTVFCGIWLGSRFFNLQSMKGQFVIVFLAMILKTVLFFIMLAVFSHDIVFPKPLWWASMGSVVCTGLIAPVFFYLFEYLNAVFFEVIRGDSKEQL